VGQYVLSVDGRIIDSHRDLAELTRRWAEQHKCVAGFIGKAGGAIEVDVDTPFFD
jgi:hypothetical protein